MCNVRSCSTFCVVRFTYFVHFCSSLFFVWEYIRSMISAHFWLSIIILFGFKIALYKFLLVVVLLKNWNEEKSAQIKRITQFFNWEWWRYYRKIIILYWKPKHEQTPSFHDRWIQIENMNWIDVQCSFVGKIIETQSHGPFHCMCIVCLWRQLFHVYCAPSFFWLFFLLLVHAFEALFLFGLSKVIVDAKLWLNYMFMCIGSYFDSFWWNFSSPRKTVWRCPISKQEPDSCGIITMLVYLSVLLQMCVRTFNNQIVNKFDYCSIFHFYWNEHEPAKFHTENLNSCE